MITLDKNVTVVAATTINLFTLAISDNSIVGGTAKAVARATTGGVDESAHYETTFAVKRFGGGAAVLLPGAPAPVVQEDDALWGMPVSVVGNNLLVDFVGDAAQTVVVQTELSFLRQPI